MKKFLIILMVMMSFPAYATTMCALNDTVAVVLDPSIVATGSGHDVTSGTWWNATPYGTIRGISTCINKMPGQNAIRAYPALTDTYNGETIVVNGTERYGKACWCRMIHPAVSAWVYPHHYAAQNSVDSCVYNCALYCKSNFTAADPKVRRFIIGSIVSD